MKTALPAGVLAACVGLFSVFGLAGCTEKPQTASTRKADVQAFQGTADGHTAAGWKAGDEASWEAQMKNRAQGQNEYSRASAP